MLAEHPRTENNNASSLQVRMLEKPCYLQNSAVLPKIFIFHVVSTRTSELMT